MKKMALVLVVTLASNTSHAFYGSQLIQKEHNQEYEKPSFLAIADEYSAHAQDEYTNMQTNQSDIEEYDQHVSDETQAPKVSAAEALIKEMLSFMLIQYLTIKEMANLYCQGMKDVIQQWFSGLSKA